MSDEPTAIPSPAPRSAAASLFVATWMALGWLFRLDADRYLVLGVPLTLLFQRFVRRQPVRALWVRDAPPFRIGRKGTLIAMALAVVPLANMAGSAAGRDWVGGLYGAATVAGAVGVAYALRHFRREHLRPLAWCLLITLGLDALQWSLFLGFGLVEVGPVQGGAAARAAIGVVSLLQYLAVVFVLEEVTFRMLDGHLHEADRGRGVPSAVALSAAWGLWHLPIGPDLTWETVGILLAVHVPYGVALSLFWRKTGNLMIPGLCHALGDSIRNAIIAGG